MFRPSFYSSTVNEHASHVHFIFSSFLFSRSFSLAAYAFMHSTLRGHYCFTPSRIYQLPPKGLQSFRLPYVLTCFSLHPVRIYLWSRCRVDQILMVPITKYNARLKVSTLRSGVNRGVEPALAHAKQAQREEKKKSRNKHPASRP